MTAVPRPPEKLAAGVSIRKTAAENGALISTVQRIKASMRSPWRRRQVRSGLPAGGSRIRTLGPAVKGTAVGRRATSVSARSSTSSGRANRESDQRVRIPPLPRGVQCELGFLGRSPSIAVGRTASRLRAHLAASGHGAVIDGPATPPIDSAMRRLPSSQPARRGQMRVAEKFPGGLRAGNATAEYRRTSRRFSVAGGRAARRRR